MSVQSVLLSNTCGARQSPNRHQNLCAQQGTEKPSLERHDNSLLKNTAHNPYSEVLQVLPWRGWLKGHGRQFVRIQESTLQNYNKTKHQYCCTGPNIRRQQGQTTITTNRARKKKYAPRSSSAKCTISERPQRRRVSRSKKNLTRLEGCEFHLLCRLLDMIIRTHSTRASQLHSTAQKPQFVVCDIPRHTQNQFRSSEMCYAHTILKLQNYMLTIRQ